MLQKLLEAKGAISTFAPNYLRIPVFTFDNTPDGAHQFNLCYLEALELSKKEKWHNIVRTPSHGISTAKKNLRLPMWDVRGTKACIEITIVSSKMIRIQFRQASSVNESENEQVIYGRQAFVAFRDELKKDGVILDDYVISNGAEIKKTIPRYLISLTRPSFANMTFENCHHIDFHNSFPAGLVNTHPEFAATITRLYENRKTNPINKAILNLSIGFMQSIDNCDAKWAHLSKDAIEDNNKRVEDLAARLTKSGRMVISYNTDGIWYKGEIYHGEGEGKRLGEWENDHIDCVFRAKSAGAYEFIEGGKYYPVIRGRTNYDKIKPRTEWEWGDIYRKEALPIKFYWIDGVGIVDETNKLL